MLPRYGSDTASGIVYQVIKSAAEERGDAHEAEGEGSGCGYIGAFEFAIHAAADSMEVEEVQLRFGSAGPIWDRGAGEQDMVAVARDRLGHDRVVAFDHVIDRYAE